MKSTDNLFDKHRNLRNTDRGVERHYRIGPAQRGYDDPSYELSVESFEGAGLRPYAPAHLRFVVDGSAHEFNWLRRTRFDGDDWGWGDVPLGEEREQYLAQVVVGGVVVRENLLSTQTYSYPLSTRLADGATGLYEMRIAQVSDRFCPGLFARHVVGT